MRHVLRGSELTARSLDSNVFGATQLVSLAKAQNQVIQLYIKALKRYPQHGLKGYNYGNAIIKSSTKVLKLNPEQEPTRDTCAKMRKRCTDRFG